MNMKKGVEKNTKKMQGRIRISGKTDDKKYLGKIREEHRMGKGGNIATTRISKSTKKLRKIQSLKTEESQE